MGTGSPLMTVSEGAAVRSENLCEGMGSPTSDCNNLHQDSLRPCRCQASTIGLAFGAAALAGATAAVAGAVAAALAAGTAFAAETAAFAGTAAFAAGVAAFAAGAAEPADVGEEPALQRRADTPGRMMMMIVGPRGSSDPRP